MPPMCADSKLDLTIQQTILVYAIVQNKKAKSIVIHCVKGIGNCTDFLDTYA